MISLRRGGQQSATTKPDVVRQASELARRHPGSPLRELEALAGALLAVFFALLHAAVAGEVSGVAQLLVHADGGRIGSGIAGDGPEHDLESAGQALADGAGLAGEPAAMDLHDHGEPVL